MNALRLAWDRTSLYLPVILMALLALGTYFLATQTQLLRGLVEPKAARHEVDYFMRKFAVKVFDASGRLKSEMTGAEAKHYADDDSLEITRVQLRSVSEEGREMRAVAERALTNSDTSEVQLFGNVVVVRDALAPTAASAANAPQTATEKLEFRGEYLHVWKDEQRLMSNKPVVMTRGSDQFSGDAMDYDDIAGVLNMRGRVRGVLIPKPSGDASTGPKP